VCVSVCVSSAKVLKGIAHARGGGQEAAHPDIAYKNQIKQ